MKRSLLYLILAALVLTGATLYQQQDQIYLQVLKHTEPPVTVVLDAGHGGSDPGKIGCNNVLEKDVNLAITLTCAKKLEKQGIQVVLTRDSDSGLYTESDSNKKTADMHRRREIIENSNAAIAVSIHQNSYPSESVYGAQVFYYEGSTDGKCLADNIQTALLDCNPDNKRTTKGNSEYYILKSGSCPTVICECGFLSSPEECAKLASTSYQEQIADAITKGILSYLYQQHILENPQSSQS
jgi:N-acetylmuramoyl-L-alanine amidase